MGTKRLLQARDGSGAVLYAGLRLTRGQEEASEELRRQVEAQVFAGPWRSQRLDGLPQQGKLRRMTGYASADRRTDAVNQLAPRKGNEMVGDLGPHHIGCVGIRALDPGRLGLDLEHVDQVRTGPDERLQGRAVDDAYTQGGELRLWLSCQNRCVSSAGSRRSSRL